MLIFDAMAEQKIREALERGEFDNLPGAGRPLDLNDDPLVPEDLRVAYRILKNAGFLPPELQLIREIRNIEQRIDKLESSDQRSRTLRKLELLNIKLSETRRSRGDSRTHARYYDKLVAKLG
ncbi:MAG: DnaJ family domain-containing protein [Betaproteobacteria bacterium]